MAIQYGKKCNTTKDCSSNICEMTYKKNNRGAPIHACVLLNQNQNQKVNLKIISRIM